MPVKGGHINGWLVNTNSYPAKELNLIYHISVQGIPQEEYLAGRQPGKERFKQEINLSEEQDEIIFHRVFEHLSACPNEQVIVYVQNINRIEKLKNGFIQRYRHTFGEEAVEFQHYMVITSQLTAKAREKAIRATDQVRCVFMTSSASRGISFKKATKILAVLQTFSIERELMEQIQLYYRMRGDTEWDTTKVKGIEFFVVDSYIHNEDDEEWHKSRAVIHLLSFLTLVRACLMSRVFGRSMIGTRSFSVVPLGGRGISPVKYGLIQDVVDSIKLIAKELAGKERFDLLRELKHEFDNTFGRMKIMTNAQIFQPGYTAKNIYPQFLQRARQNLSHLIEFQPFQTFLFANGMLIFRVPDAIREHVTFLDDLRKKLTHIIELLKFERENQGRFPNTYVEHSHDEKRYVAIPVLAFTMFEALRDYEPQEGEETFLDVLHSLTRMFTDVSSVTPISGRYENIPFITFKSDALEESFESLFQQNHLLTSTETNILNLLLLEKI
ncbi:helicase-related protein [Thermoactinomyces daqus]|uniref:helicase-related protein n=1 Tax=Thermoactinomyces daqus TaxID=1329516 RepID=UPI000519F637|nr:helicase-related protein [Thermoactinomyces daqus]